ncbi:zinc finger protein OZF-like [Chironomus tepperi]|uniref:zinc finger protein OZF-like n=1 Tax=Chironomus tepperi TaxID=113505 RepID=UPI00391F335A
MVPVNFNSSFIEINQLKSKHQIKMSTKISNYFNTMTKFQPAKESKFINSNDLVLYIKIEKIIKEEKRKPAYADVEKITCEFCKKTFKTKTILTQHKKHMHSDKINCLNCNFCDAKCLSKKSLDNHTKKYHSSGEIQKFECDFDGKCYKTKASLYAHMKVHIPKVECEICHILIRKANLNNHMITHNGSGQEFKCDFCPKSFKTKALLKSHQPLHVKQFECDICKKMFSHLRQLKSHKKLYHENPGSFECSTCGKIFNSKCGLKAHQMTHDKFAPKNLKCQKCNYKTNTKRNYEQHLNSHERKEKIFAAMKNPLKCDKCFIFCSTPMKLRLHLINSHPENPFQCDLCGKYLKTKVFLRNHMKICLNKKNNKNC